jgi:hypothetical protein
MIKNFSYLSLLSCLLLLASCASETKKPEVKTYSADTNRAFEMIERGTYLKQAPSDAPPPQIEAPKKPVKKNQPAEEVVIEEKKSATHPNSKVEERLIEINQNLAFYCMKHRKDAVYGGDEEKCLKFVKKVQSSCQNKHRLVNSKLVHCIRTGLKNNR